MDYAVFLARHHSPLDLRNYTPLVPGFRSGVSRHNCQQPIGYYRFGRYSVARILTHDDIGYRIIRGVLADYAKYNGR